MKRLVSTFLVMLTGFSLMASDLPGTVSGSNDGGIYPVVIAVIMLVSAVAVRLITVSQNAKSGKKTSLN